MRPRFRGWTLLVAVVVTAGCAPAPSTRTETATSVPDLAGAWRSQVQFRDGAFASVKDLEFMYVFNAGGTMTESSNYDGAPPVPPAYGAWKRSGPNQFVARYEFYSTQPPAKIDEITKGSGWLPAGRGVLHEAITLGPDGKTFTSTIRYEALDRAGQPIAGGGMAEGRGTRIETPE